ncbi:MAG: TonB-dependent receptor plug domain-containing protein [Gemmatimonadaceae bacterium]
MTSLNRLGFRAVLDWLAGVFAAAIALLLIVPAAEAQESGLLRGVVREQHGRPVTRAQVRFTPGDHATTTDSGGRFSLRIPVGVAGMLLIGQAGFDSVSLAIAPLRAAVQHDIAVTLTAPVRLDVVTVVAERERPLLNTLDAATGGTVERRELERLPTDARDPIALGYNIPGVAQATGFFGDAPKLSLAGANGLYTQYSLDGLENNEGFLGGPRVEVPLSALARFSVLSATYGADFGRSSNGVVNMETRSGGDSWTGEVFAYSRPGIPVDAYPAVVPVGQDPDDFRRALEGFRRTQVGGALGGPLRRDRERRTGTRVFGAVEYTSENEDRIASTARATFTGREVRDTWKTFGRVDHGWSPTQTTTLRVTTSRVSREGRGSGIVAPEADITVQRNGSATALVHRSALRDGRASNEASVQVGSFRWNFPPAASDFSRPQVTIREVQADAQGREDTVVVGVAGSSNFVFDERETQLQLKDVFEATPGGRWAGHTLRLGADGWRSQFRLTASSTNPSGSYVVLDEGNIPRQPDGRYAFRDIPADVRVLAYTVDAAQKQVDLSQTLIGAFVEDRWRATPSLTVTLGLRWDYDDLTSRGGSSPDLNNFQPRASVNWVAGPSTVLRAAAGLYAGKFPYAIYSDAIQFGPDGNQTVTFDGSAAPAFLAGPRTATLDRSALPPGEIRELFALGLEQPMSRQLSAGVQRQLGRRAAVSFDGVWVDTRNLPRSWDLNPNTRGISPADSVSLPPSAGDGFRPVTPAPGGFRRRTTSESGGRSTYAALFTSLRYDATRSLLLDANWVWSRSRNDTEDINFNATQGNRFDLEWADAVNDRRHKITARATYTAVPRLTVAGIGDYQTGTPINRIAHFRDLDGSGDTFGNGFLGNHDRFHGVPRNGERLPDAFLMHASVSYALPFSGSRRALELRADAFNLFNSVNVSGVANGIPGGGTRTQVGRPGDPVVVNNAGAPRQIQFSARYAF